MSGNPCRITERVCSSLLSLLTSSVWIDPWQYMKCDLLKLLSNLPEISRVDILLQVLAYLWEPLSIVCPVTSLIPLLSFESTFLSSPITSYFCCVTRSSKQISEHSSNWIPSFITRTWKVTIRNKELGESGFAYPSQQFNFSSCVPLSYHLSS